MEHNRVYNSTIRDLDLSLQATRSERNSLSTEVDQLKSELQRRADSLIVEKIYSMYSMRRKTLEEAKAGIIDFDSEIANARELESIARTGLPVQPDATDSSGSGSEFSGTEEEIERDNDEGQDPYPVADPPTPPRGANASFPSGSRRILHHESFLRSRLEIRQVEFELKEQDLKNDMYRALSEQQDEALKDLPTLRTKLEKSQKEATTLKREHTELVEKIKIFESKNEKLVVVTNNTTSKVQEKINLIDQLRDKMDEVKAMIEAWKGRMNMLASEKEATKMELASVENQFCVAKEKADKWSQVNDDFRAQLSSTVTERDSPRQEYVVLSFKLDATSSDVKEILAQYKANVVVAKARLKTKIEYIKWLSRRETVEEIHARGFDLSAKIEDAKILEAEAKELYEPEGP
ncbi:uncharacterized protein [Nicotiana tomentosiformis]|uniref:uncharacterized protein n=1 Tax=Nicotiana tomentosiformis TaxID=4098 RepID=UPI00388C6936